MFTRFTDRARKVCSLAREEALRWNHDYIGAEHMLLGLIAEGSGVAAEALKKLGVDPGKVRDELNALMKPGPPDPSPGGQLPFTPRAKRVLEFAIDESILFEMNCVDSEHLLLGLLHEKEGIAGQVLAKLGLNLESVRWEVAQLLGIKIVPGAVVAVGRDRQQRKTEFLMSVVFELEKLNRDILLRRYQSNESEDQIAREMNLPLAEVEQRIADSKEKLMKILFGGN